MASLFHATFESNAQGKLSVKSGCKRRARNNLYRTYQLVHIIWGENLKQTTLYPVIYQYYTTQVKPLLEDTNHKGWYSMAQPTSEYPLDLTELDAVDVCASNSTSYSNLAQTTKTLRGIVHALIQDISASVPHKVRGGVNKRMVPMIYEHAQQLIKDIARHHLTLKAVLEAASDDAVIDPETHISDEAVADFLLEVNVPRLPDKASDKDMETLFGFKTLDTLQNTHPTPEVLSYHKQKQKLLTNASFHHMKEQALIGWANQSQSGINMQNAVSNIVAHAIVRISSP
ncbi:hypothetical protein BDZ94DRAFT_1379073, partial [Collybia nuda]